MKKMRMRRMRRRTRFLKLVPNPMGMGVPWKVPRVPHQPTVKDQRNLYRSGRMAYGVRVRRRGTSLVLSFASRLRIS
jgi:hypothetical protein